MVYHLFFIRVLWLGFIWWLLIGGDYSSWMIGFPTVLIAAFVSVKIQPTSVSLRVATLPRFLAFFLKHAFLGSVDIARRAMRSEMPISPSVVDYHMALTHRAAERFFIGVMGLLPGTLCLARDGHCLSIHVVDSLMDVDSELRRLEGLVEALFIVREIG